jgi:hypothetical protein
MHNLYVFGVNYLIGDYFWAWLCVIIFLTKMLPTLKIVLLRKKQPLDLTLSSSLVLFCLVFFRITIVTHASQNEQGNQQQQHQYPALLSTTTPPTPHLPYVSRAPVTNMSPQITFEKI